MNDEHENDESNNKENDSSSISTNNDINVERSRGMYRNLKNAVETADSNANEKKKHHALLHLKHFLRNCEELTFKSHEEIISSDMNDELVKFTTYLAEHARKFLKEDSQLLVYGSAHGYLSAFKNYFMWKCEDEEIPKV